jgi:uncharacterized protein (DUF305 family)
MKHYRMLVVNLVLSAAAMYLVMFTMIDGLDDFYNNANTAYMTAMMVAPMGLLMLLTTESMYESRKVNVTLYIAFAALFVGGYAFMRGQTLIGDVQFLRSMIPHHSGAILMCSEAKIADPEIAALCSGVVRSQQDEIDQMVAMASPMVWTNRSSSPRTPFSASADTAFD